MTLLQFLRALRAHWRLLFLILVFTVGVAAAISLAKPKTYTAETALVVDFKGVDVDPVTGAVIPRQGGAYLTTQVDIIASRNVARKVVQELKLEENAFTREEFIKVAGGAGSINDWLADRLLRRLDVEPSRGSNVISIKYAASDPQYAAAIANAFATAYIQTNLELKVEPARQNAAWFDEQLKALRRDLESAQTKLSEYQSAKGITSIDERLDLESSRLAEISSQLVEAQGETYERQSHLRQASKTDSRNKVDTLPEVLGSPLIQGLKAELARAEAKFAELSSQLGRNHPQYQQAQAEVAELRSKLSAEVTTTSKGINITAQISERRESELHRALETQKAKVLMTKVERDQMAILQREVENAQRNYETAATRYSQTRLESQANQTNIAVLNPAIAPLRPSSPNVGLNITLSVIFGALLGIGVSALKEMMDRRVRSKDDLAEDLGWPVLGVLPSGDAVRTGFWARFLPASRRLLKPMAFQN